MKQDTDHDCKLEHQVGVTDIGDRVILVHGDLLTGEQNQSLQETWSEEATPWHQFQFMVYVMGLFHLKMGSGGCGSSH